MADAVTMTCMTTKQKFDVTDPSVVRLANNRYAYRVKCPWEGKNGKELYAWKFCSLDAYNRYNKAQEEEFDQVEAPDEPTEQEEAPEEPTDNTFSEPV